MTREEAIKELKSLMPREGIVCSWTKKHRESLLIAIDALNPWKSVNEELPKCDIEEEWGEKSGKMIFVDADGIYHIGEYCTGLYDDNKKDCFWWAYFEENPVINNVTHWMSIPELLKEDTK